MTRGCNYCKDRLYANFLAMVWKNRLRYPPHRVRLKKQPLILAQKCIVFGVAFCLHLIFCESTLMWFATKPFYFSQCTWCGTMPRFSRERAQDGEQTEIAKLSVERFSNLKRSKANAQLDSVVFTVHSHGNVVVNDCDAWQCFHLPVFSLHVCDPLNQNKILFAILELRHALHAQVLPRKNECILHGSLETIVTWDRLTVAPGWSSAMAGRAPWTGKRLAMVRGQFWVEDIIHGYLSTSLSIHYTYIHTDSQPGRQTYMHSIHHILDSRYHNA